MGQNSDHQDYGQGDIFSSLISGLFTSAIGMAMMLDQVDNNQSEGVAKDQQLQQQETEQQRLRVGEQSKGMRVNTLIQRRRDSIDPQQARETAMMNFDAEYPEQQQSQGQRLA